MAGGVFREYSAYFGEATEVWKRHVIGVTIEAFDEYRDSVCHTLQNITQDSSRPVPDGSAGGQAVNNQEEMSRNVQTAMENAQHLAQQRIADTLAQTFNAPPPILLSSISNQTIQVNQPSESATSHGGIISDQNDGDSSMDVSIKSEVASSSESECEADSDGEEVQVKDEPNEEEDNMDTGLNENDDGAEASINLNEDIASDDEAGHLDAEEDGDGVFGEDEQMDDNDYHHVLENQESDHDGQDECDHEGAIIDEETDGEDSDYSEEQEDMSGVEDNEQDSSDEEEEASLGVAGPSTSAKERQGTRRVAKRQIVSGKTSKRQRIRRNVETVPLGVITKKLKCTVPGCKKMVKNKRSMNRHLLSSHQLKEYRCLVRRCHGKVSTSFSSQSQLADHRDQVHGSTTEWTCKCSKKFNTYNDLCSHYWRYHELGHFTCSKDGCPVKSTTTRAKVSDHQNSHREAKYQCPVDDCDWSFKYKSTLDRHLLTHSGERPFPCPECDKSFNQQGNLTAHLAIHSEQRPFPCPECDKSFTRKGNLTTHLRIHRNDKCFHCTWPQCTLSASDRSSIIQHIRTAHFKLPRTKKQQLAADIVDDRDASDYLAKN